MTRPPLSTLSAAQWRILETIVRREAHQLPNFVSDLVEELALKAESSLGPTLQRMGRLGVILLQGGGIKGRQRLIVSTEKGRLLLNASPHSSSTPRAAFPAIFPKVRTLPLLGAIPAGPLEEVITRGYSEGAHGDGSEGDTGVEAIPVDELLKCRAGDFLLRIKGDSMIGDGILDGDLVLLRPGTHFQQGEIAAVLTSGSGADCDSTLKHVYRVPPRAGRQKQREEMQTAGFRGEAVHSSTSTDTSTDTSTGEQIEGGEIILKASNPAYPDIQLPAESVRIAGVFRGLIRSPRGLR